MDDGGWAWYHQVLYPASSVISTRKKDKKKKKKTGKKWLKL
jgi:hypothetical protein